MSDPTTDRVPCLECFADAWTGDADEPIRGIRERAKAHPCGGTGYLPPSSQYPPTPESRKAP